jgi:UDP-N-acetylmuramate: L-alanyl-gamma-D-glutamyl-meso-diaminopimelate ligase
MNPKQAVEWEADSAVGITTTHSDQNANSQASSGTADHNIGIIFPSGKLRVLQSTRDQRLAELADRGFSTRVFEPETESPDGTSAGHTLERAVMLAQALTLRRYPVLWAARGGYGSTTLLPALERMLPPVIPDKTLIGYSDVSFIGTVLTLKYPTFTYVMGAHAFEPDLFAKNRLQSELTMQLLRGETPEPLHLICKEAAVSSDYPSEISGSMLPLNLSLAESLCAIRSIRPVRGQILFLEDVAEDMFRLLRKLDSLINSGFLDHTEAIVLGSFTQCPDESGQECSLTRLSQIIAQRTNLPVFVLPVFGHEQWRLPLVSGAKVAFVRKTEDTWSVEISFSKHKTKKSAAPYGSDILDVTLNQKSRLAVHFTGIGGTGMTAVAGLAQSAGVSVTGSDGPIYPPMSTILESLGIKPFEGYHKTNIEKPRPDAVVLANAISRVDGSLQTNAELEALFTANIPVYSFPGFLRAFFLRQSMNIVVTGTHGKTTTSAAIAHALQQLEYDPSWLIGGSPRNFERGFKLGKKNLFVLEGDEYDTALFDKGPKFLHYEPRITVVNNIEFDHADIYPDINAITQEFERVMRLTTTLKGIVVANSDEEQVRNLLESTECIAITFGTQAGSGKFPHWEVKGFETTRSGMIVRVVAPGGQEHEFRTGLFGLHNSLNAAATLAALHAFHLLQEKPEGYTADKLLKASNELSASAVARWGETLGSFLGVRRRFELLFQDDHISVFDDFAHHPTAVHGTLQAFRDYHNLTAQTGQLKVCFDPRNATMRRSILQNDLSQALALADRVYVGKVAKDLRIPEEQRMNSGTLCKQIGEKASAFESNEDLLSTALSEVTPGDTVIFMSSGSFDRLPHLFMERYQSQKAKDIQ